MCRSQQATTSCLCDNNRAINASQQAIVGSISCDVHIKSSGCLAIPSSPHGHKQLLTFYTTKFLRLHLTLYTIFINLFTYITKLFFSFFYAVFIFFWCKYITTKLILQTKNIYRHISKTYNHNNLCINKIYCLKEPFDATQ